MGELQNSLDDNIQHAGEILEHLSNEPNEEKLLSGLDNIRQSLRRASETQETIRQRSWISVTDDRGRNLVAGDSIHYHEKMSSENVENILEGFWKLNADAENRSEALKRASDNVGVGRRSSLSHGDTTRANMQEQELNRLYGEVIRNDQVKQKLSSAQELGKNLLNELGKTILYPTRTAMSPKECTPGSAKENSLMILEQKVRKGQLMEENPRIARLSLKPSRNASNPSLITFTNLRKADPTRKRRARRAG